MDRPIVAVVARAPSADGKTRLFERVGTADRAGLRRAFLMDTLDAVIEAGGVEPAVAYTPAAAGAEIAALVPGRMRRLIQRGDTLGDRMRNVIADLLPSAPAVILVGSDLPTLPPSFVAQAAALTREHPEQVVLGPAADGGYYLIGMSSPRAALFDGIPWGTGEVLERTLVVAAASGIEIALLPGWYDVDDASDLDRVLADSGDGPAAGRARRTRQWMAANRLA